MEERAEGIVNDILRKDPEIYLSGSHLQKLDSIQKKWMERLNN